MHSQFKIWLEVEVSQNNWRCKKIFLDRKNEKKETNDAAIKSITNIFRIKKENKSTKCRILTDIRNLFERKEEDHDKPVRVNIFWSNSHTEYKSKSDRSRKSIY